MMKKILTALRSVFRGDDLFLMIFFALVEPILSHNVSKLTLGDVNPFAHGSRYAIVMGLLYLLSAFSFFVWASTREQGVMLLAEGLAERSFRERVYRIFTREWSCTSSVFWLRLTNIFLVICTGTFLLNALYLFFGFSPRWVVVLWTIFMTAFFVVAALYLPGRYDRMVEVTLRARRSMMLPVLALMAFLFRAAIPYRSFSELAAASQKTQIGQSSVYVSFSVSCVLFYAIFIVWPRVASGDRATARIWAFRFLLFVAAFFAGFASF